MRASKGEYWKGKVHPIMIHYIDDLLLVGVSVTK